MTVRKESELFNEAKRMKGKKMAENYVDMTKDEIMVKNLQILKFDVEQKKKKILAT